MPEFSPILSAPDAATVLDLGDSQVFPRITSDQTYGAFSVVEFVSAPGQGVGVHTHANEEELVYLLEGKIEVALGDQSITVEPGACALLPRGIPHGYQNVGDTPSRLLAILLPGQLDGFFTKLSELLTHGGNADAIGSLAERYGLTLDD